MNQLVTGWQARLPGTDRILPMLCIDAAEVAEYARRGDDCAELKTFIFHESHAELAAFRLARALARHGMAPLRPEPGIVAIILGQRHRLLYCTSSLRQATTRAERGNLPAVYAFVDGGLLSSAAEPTQARPRPGQGV